MNDFVGEYIYRRHAIGAAQKGITGAELVAQIAKPWAEIFGTPMPTLLAITEIESHHNPHLVDGARYNKGGAWGYGQQMADEADYKVGVIKHRFGKEFPELLPALAKWKHKPKKKTDLSKVAATYKLDPDQTKEFLNVIAELEKKGQYPDNLLDPDLNLILAAWQLGQLTKEFGDFPTVAAAYHQGAGAVRARLAGGEPAVGKKQPKGVAYVVMAMNARKKYLMLPYALASNP